MLNVSIGLGMVAPVGLSRIYMGAYYLSDVAGAIGSSTCWLVITFTGIATWRKWKAIRRERSLNVPRTAE